MTLFKRDQKVNVFQAKMFLLVFYYMLFPFLILHCNNTDKSIPNSPGSLQATPVSSSEIGLSWTDNSDNEIGFRIERASDEGGSPGVYEIIQTASSGENSFNNTGLEVDTTYHYRVCAFNDAGDSLPAEASATTQGNPSNTSKSLTQFGITWTFDKEYECGQFANGDYYG